MSSPSESASLDVLLEGDHVGELKQLRVVDLVSPQADYRPQPSRVERVENRLKVDFFFTFHSVFPT